MANRIHVMNGSPAARKRHEPTATIGSHGTSGTLNGRFASGWVRRSTITPAATIAKANSVPMLVRSTISSMLAKLANCLLYTSDAADEEDSVDLGGRRIIK